MRSLAFAILATSLLVAPRAQARDHGDLPGSIHLGHELQDPARWAPRHDTRASRFVITSEDGKVDLLLMPTTVAFQLSDRCMNHIERELRNEQNENEENPLGDAIRTAVLAGVRVLLKHSAECPIRELRDVDYRDGELVFTTWDGDRLFDRFQIDDGQLASSFSERQARAFVREFRRVRAAYR